MVSLARASSLKIPPSDSQNLERGQSSFQNACGAMQASVLALNRNYLTVKVISARRAFCLLFKGAAEVIHVEDGIYHTYSFDNWLEYSLLKVSLNEIDDSEDWVQSVNFRIQVPRVIRLLSYDRVPQNTVKFNRKNVFLRDGHRCQYCGKRYSTPRLSLDHVLPKSRGGPETWENIVCACLKCNVEKGGRTPSEAGMKLLQPPVKPQRNPALSRQLSLSKYAVWANFVPQSTD